MLPEQLRYIIGERRNDAKHLYRTINVLLFLILVIIMCMVYVKMFM